MPFATAGLNAAVAGLIAAGNKIGFHSDDPGATGANELTGGGYGRQASTFPAPSGGSSTGSQVSTSVAAGTTIKYWSLWSATTGGTFLGGFPLTANEQFGAAGVMQFTPTLADSN